MSTEPEKTPVVESRKLFRRKPLLVEATPNSSGWQVLEAGREIQVSAEDFLLLYESVDISSDNVDAGLPDMEPGATLEKEGRRLIRVVVIGGRGNAAYWHMNKPVGQECGFKVVADMITDPTMSHFAGKFVETFEGRPGTRTWVVVGK